jgi:hypothetical protein
MSCRSLLESALCRQNLKVEIGSSSYTEFKQGSNIGGDETQAVAWYGVVWTRRLCNWPGLWDVINFHTATLWCYKSFQI